MSVPRTRSTKDKPSLQDSCAKSRWKSLALHGVDPGEIYGHTIVQHAASESLYLFGGCSRTGTFHNSVLRFHLPSQCWEVMQTEGKRPKGRHFHSAVILDHSMYIFGGKCNGYMNDINCLNLTTMEWVEMEQVEGNVPSRRYGHSMVVHNRNFYVYGGYDDFGYKCNDMYEFRPTSNKWYKVKTTGDAPERYHHAAVAHAGSMYLFGGSAADLTQASSLYEFRFSTSTWTRVPTQNKPPEPRWGHSCFIHENQLYILGGCDNILCFKDVHRISLEAFAWKKVKKVSGFDPRYFGCCILIHSDWPSCNYQPPPKDESHSSTSEGNEPTVAGEGVVTLKSLASSGITVLHHSQAAVATNPTPGASRASPTPIFNPQLPFRAIGIPTTGGGGTLPNVAPLAATSTPPIVPPALNGSGSSSSPSPTPPLPSVTPLSPLPISDSLGLGNKLLYHGGRNIHNWAFGDMLMLSLEGEDEYDPYLTQMQSLVGNSTHSDILFEFPSENVVIHAHRAILAIRCEPFAKMLGMSLSETKEGKIPILDVPSSLFREFLFFIYTGKLPAMDALQDNLYMLYLADKYFLPQLKSIAESRTKTLLSSANIRSIWDSAVATHTPGLQRACIRFVTRFADVLLTADAKKTLPKALVMEAKAKLADRKSVV